MDSCLAPFDNLKHLSSPHVFREPTMPFGSNTCSRRAARCCGSLSAADHLHETNVEEDSAVGAVFLGWPVFLVFETLTSDKDLSAAVKQLISTHHKGRLDYGSKLTLIWFSESKVSVSNNLHVSVKNIWYKRALCTELGVHRLLELYRSFDGTTLMGPH